MIEKLEEIDRDLFVFLNGLHSEFLDPLMVLFSEKFFWLPVYLIILFFIWKAYNVKTALWALLAVAIVITICDRVSVEFFKEVYQRYRPCHNALITESVHIVNGHCGGKFGFVSSHASNFFGVATFCAMLLRRRYAASVWLLFLWALLVCYSRIYLGVHYPADIAVGALLGSTVGVLIFMLFKRTVMPKT